MCKTRRRAHLGVATERVRNRWQDREQIVCQLRGFSASGNTLRLHRRIGSSTLPGSTQMTLHSLVMKRVSCVTVNHVFQVRILAGELAASNGESGAALPKNGLKECWQSGRLRWIANPKCRQAS